MAWKALDRNVAPPRGEGPVLSRDLRARIEAFCGRYETRRGALLPALHLVQDELGHVGWEAQEELAELLGLPAVDVFDVVSFYTYFWTAPRGRKTVVVCRSISCEVLGSDAVLAECRKVLGIGEHQTTPDGQYSLATEECLAACDHGPCLFINEREYHGVRPEQVRGILSDPDNDRVEGPRSDLYDGARRRA